MSDLPERLRTAVASISPGIGHVDLTAALAAAAKDGVLPYYSDDLHWTPAGHGIAAEATYAYLVAHPGSL